MKTTRTRDDSDQFEGPVVSWREQASTALAAASLGAATAGLAATVFAPADGPDPTMPIAAAIAAIAAIAVVMLGRGEAQ